MSVLDRINDELEAYEKRCMVLSMIGRYRPEVEGARLQSLYDERRRLSDEGGLNDE